MSCIRLGHGFTDGRVQISFFSHDIYLLTSFHTFQSMVHAYFQFISSITQGFSLTRSQGFYHGQISVTIVNNGQQTHEDDNNDQKSSNLLICKLNKVLTSKLVLR